MTDAAQILAVGALALLGLVAGSFLNVLVHRVPAGLSIVHPGSHCPNCEARIRPRDNVPVLSWLVLRGRCRECHAPISVRYPLVEASTGILWGVLAWWALGPAGMLGLLPLLLILGAAGVALTVIDLDHHRLPDAIVLPLYPLTVAGLALAGVLDGEWPLVSTAAGLVIWLVPIGGLWLFSGGRGMGFGDVKLSPVLGACLGWAAVASAVTGLLAAFVVGALVGLALMIAGRVGRRGHLPFGPFLLLGALLGLLAGPALAGAYLDMLGG